MIPPVKKQTLTRCVLKVELGKPVFSPSMKESFAAYGSAGKGTSEEANVVL